MLTEALSWEWIFFVNLPVGIAAFAASLLCGLASSAGLLIVARALQGLGAALVSPAALSIITTTFAEGPERTKALGVWGGIAAGGGAVGLLLGGVLTELLSWEWVFFVNVPIGLAAGLASARIIPESKLGDRVGGFDLAGAVLATTGLIALTYAIVQSEEWGFGDARTLAFAGGAALLLGLFVAVELRHRAPLVRLSLFRVRSLAAANGSMLLVAGGLFAFFFFGTIYLQRVKGYSPIETGFAFLPMALGIGVGAGIAQQLIRRFGVKPVLVGGLLGAALGMVWMTTLTPGSSYAGGFLPGLVLIALGMGNTFVPLTLSATANLDADDQGLASGVFNTAQQVGGALGLAILSTVASDATAARLAEAGGRPSPAVANEALVDGFTTAFTVGAGLMLLGALLAAVWLRRRDVAGVSIDDALAVPAA